jgi:hypothetical protein
MISAFSRAVANRKGGYRSTQGKKSDINRIEECFKEISSRHQGAG